MKNIDYIFMIQKLKMDKDKLFSYFNHNFVSQVWFVCEKNYNILRRLFIY